MKKKSLYAGLLSVLFVVFVLYAVFFNAFGTNSPLMIAYFHIQESQQGFVLTVQSVACLLVALYLAMYGERYNKLAGVTLGFAIMIGASLLIGLIPLVYGQGQGYGLLLALFTVGGVGFTMIDLLMNGVIADTFPHKKDTYLPCVHAFYGVGAMLAPLFVTSLVHADQPATFALPYTILGCVGCAVLAGLVAISRQVTPETPYADRAALRARTANNPAEVFKSSRAWLFLASCTLYLCFQTGLSTWLPSYCTQALYYDYTTGGTVLSLYFLGALFMRFLSPLIYRKVSVDRFYVLTLSASVAVFLLVFLVPLPSVVFMVLVTLGGFLQGGSVPSMVILCCNAFPTRTASASAIVVLSVSLSGFISPLVMGWMIERLPFAVPMVIATLCVLASTILVRMATARRACNNEKSACLPQG